MALSARDKNLIGGGAAVLAGGLLVWAMWPKKAAAASSTSTAPIDTGIYVHPQCSDYTVTNRDKLTAVLEPIVNKLVGEGERNPWVIASAMENRVAPQCYVPPTEPRSWFEAYLFYHFVIEAIIELRERNLITAVEAQNYWAQINAWSLQHEVPEDRLFQYAEPKPS